MKSLRDLGKQPVPVELMVGALEAIERLPESERTDYESRVLAVIRLLHSRKYPDETRRELLLGIQYRLDALSLLTEHKAYQAWSMKGEAQGMDYVHADLLAAAAVEPLIVDERSARFDPEAFFVRVMKLSAMRGTA